MEAVFTFYNTHGAITGEKAMLALGLPVEVINIPSAISAGCGLCLLLPGPDLEKGLAALRAKGIECQQVYRCKQGIYTEYKK